MERLQTEISEPVAVVASIEAQYSGFSIIGSICV
jgi:hypothetical protein